MNIKRKIFNSECFKMENGSNIHFINIKTLDDNIKKYIDDNIISICEGDSSTDLSTIKKRLLWFLASKKDSYLEMGAISEFFAHLYLKEIGFKQDCLFFNLEEPSIKKGFDGYYSREKEEWIFESKSGNRSTVNISHKTKIKEAYDDLRKKISGNVNNNPWQNAYNHASQIDVKSVDHVRKNLKKLSNDFDNKIFHNIENFNIIPGSTIFLEGKWESINTNETLSQINNLIKILHFKKIEIICINKLSVDLFLQYLNEP